MAGFTSLPGAVVDGDAVTHFGEPLREQRALEQGRAIAPLGDRAVVSLTGPDRLTWLDSITSQSVAHLPAGVSSELLVLDPQGRVEHAAGIVDDGETAWLLVDRDDAGPLSAWLLRMRFRAQVDIAVRDELRVIGFMGDAAGEQLASIAPSAVVWHDPWRAVAAGGWQYAQITEHPGSERDWREAIVTAAQSDELAANLGGLRPAGVLAADALRIAAWRPRWARERDERLIPHEVDWIRSAVHLNKGCYRGQETVAKVHNLGHPPRRLVMLHLDGSDSVLPAPGDDVRAEAEGDEVGRITSSAMHHELGPIALAVISRRVPADAVLHVRSGDTDITGAQEVVVPADAGSVADVPRLTRLSRRPLKQD